MSFGLVLAIQGITGSVLEWRPELEGLLVPHTALLNAPPAGSPAALQGVDAGYAAVRQAFPAAAVRMLRLQDADRGVAEWMLQIRPVGASPASQGRRATVYTALADGSIVKQRGPHRDLLQFLTELHHNLLLGPLGRTLLGVLALATVLLALSGLWLWWPARWMPSRFRPRAAARPLHYALGFWAMWPLLAIALTATYFVWREPIQHLFGVPVEVHRESAGGAEAGHGQHRRQGDHDRNHPVDSLGLTAPAKPAGNAENSAVAAAPLATVLSVAQSAVQVFGAGATVSAVRLPEGHGSYTVLFARPGERFRDAANSLTVQLSPDGQAHVVSRTLGTERPANQRFLNWLPRVHQGEFGGLLIRILWSLVGLVPAILYGSGFLMWRRRLAGERGVRRLA